MSNPTPRPGLRLVRVRERREEADQFSLVLVAMGVPALVGPVEGGFGVFVEEGDVARARAELAAYDSENASPKGSAAGNERAPRLEAAMLFWAVLLFFFAALHKGAFSVDWLGAGAARAGLMREGEWWRAVTALTLHTGSAHLVGNLAFGTFFSLQLARVTGSGMAWLAMLLAGAAGNAVNALVQSAGHASIGASTAVFAGLGLLAALRQYGKTAGTTASTLRAWAPLAGGFMLLAFLGLSGERTDIFAHVFGFLSGLAAGWWLGRLDRDWRRSDGFQLRCAGAAAWIVLVAWTLAITLSP